ncbi:MAG: tetratricopeptide repeat protein [Candidatus Aureabacteria bacterium]|nr:tetratricopeptide repeat protein [Candidatus Auribacterota bacterium]
MRLEDSLKITAVLLAFSCVGWNYPAARKNGQGNELYKRGDYEGALKKYTEATTESPGTPELYYNIGDALYNLSKFKEASELFNKVAPAGDQALRSRSLYNMGNARYRIWKPGEDTSALKEAAEAYVKSLEANPRDRDAKYNLEYVLKQIKQQEKKQEQQQKDQKNKEQEKKEQEKKRQEKKEQKDQKEKEEQKEEKKEEKKEQENRQQKQEQPQQQQSTPQPAKQLNEEEAKNLIENLDRDARDPQHFLETQMPPAPKKVDKDW